MIKLDPINIIGKGRGESQFVSEVGTAGIKQWWNESLNPGQSLFSWVMSNHWETNYKAYQEGEITYRYVMIPHDKGYNAFEGEKFGCGICQPLIPVEVKPGSKAHEACFTINSEQIVVTSLRSLGEDGNLIKYSNCRIGTVSFSFSFFSCTFNDLNYVQTYEHIKIKLL